jgi:hypothetical protein
MTTSPAGRARTEPPIAVWLLPSRFDAVLFDLDGVLTDTATLHLAAWREMFAGYAPEAPGITDARRVCAPSSRRAGSTYRRRSFATWPPARTAASGRCWRSAGRR